MDNFSPDFIARLHLADARHISLTCDTDTQTGPPKEITCDLILKFGFRDKLTDHHDDEMKHLFDQSVLLDQVLKHRTESEGREGQRVGRVCHGPADWTIIRGFTP